jgi:DMSO/TMAO reductase YedYZ molybdopterin-dependent catalytic subunit
MARHFVSRGFVGKPHPAALAERVPPGQHLVHDFPVLTAGPTPRTPLAEWSFSVGGLVRAPGTWSWDDLLALPAQRFTVDIHCVTKWSKLDTVWQGVSIDAIFAKLDLDPRARYASAWSDGGYTTNLPLGDLLDGKAFIAYHYDDQPLAPAHGGPARLVVPHLYLWKSAKWVRGITLMEHDKPGFWESLGYNNHGDPWKEERYSGR